MTEQEKNQIAREILYFPLQRHDRGQCECTEDGNLCEAAQWLVGKSTDDEIIEDYPDRAQQIFEEM